MDLTIGPNFWALVAQSVLSMSSSVFWSMLWTVVLSIGTVCLSLKILPTQIDDYLLDTQDIRVGATFMVFGIVFGFIFSQYHGQYDTSVYSDLENWIWLATGIGMAFITSTVTRLALFAALAVMNGRPIKGLYEAEIRKDKNISLYLLKLGILGLSLLVCVVPIIM